MIDLQQFREIDPEDVSDEKMMYFRDELVKMHDELVDAWTEEVKKYDTENFDPYSFRGERLIKKIAKKHTPKIVEVDMLIEVIDNEMARRSTYNEQQHYVEGGKHKVDNDTKEEFLEKEKKKIERTRKKYED